MKNSKVSLWISLHDEKSFNTVLCYKQKLGFPPCLCCNVLGKDVYMFSFEYIGFLLRNSSVQMPVSRKAYAFAHET